MTQPTATHLRAAPRSLPVASRLSIAAGLLLVGIAALLSDEGIERALLGEVNGTLSWGPTLFRALLAAHGIVLIIAGITSAARPRVVAPALVRGDIWPWVLLAVLSGVALGLRLWRLDSCLWFDEVWTLVDLVRLPLTRIVTSFSSQNQHMLFSLLAHTSIAAFGESAWALRLPSVFFGVASLWALYLLGRRLVGPGEALLACALMTVSYHHVWFSQNARGYTGLLFFATLATWLWLEALARARWSWRIAYATAGALGMWTHLTMIFVPMAHAMLYALHVMHRAWGGRQRGSVAVVLREAWPMTATWLLTGSLTLQLYALSLPDFLRGGLHEVSLESEWTNPLWVITESLRSLQAGFGALTIVLGGLVVAAAGWLSLAKRDGLAAGALVLPALLGAASMLSAGHNLWPRFFFFSMGFMLLIAVHGTLTVPRAVCARMTFLRVGATAGSTIGVLVMSIVVVLSALLLPRCYALPKQDFIGARDYIERARQPGDAVVAVGMAGFAYGRYYAPQWESPKTTDALEAVRRSHAKVWLVYTLPIGLRTYSPEIWRVVDRDFEIVKVFPGTLGGGEVTVCQERGKG